MRRASGIPLPKCLQKTVFTAAKSSCLHAAQQTFPFLKQYSDEPRADPGTHGTWSPIAPPPNESKTTLKILNVLKNSTVLGVCSQVVLSFFFVVTICLLPTQVSASGKVRRHYPRQQTGGHVIYRPDLSEPEVRVKSRA